MKKELPHIKNKTFIYVKNTLVLVSLYNCAEEQAFLEIVFP